jgi:hypothetical protein
MRAASSCREVLYLVMPCRPKARRHCGALSLIGPSANGRAPATATVRADRSRERSLHPEGAMVERHKNLLSDRVGGNQFFLGILRPVSHRSRISA